MCALLLGERLDMRALERDKPLGVAPLTVYIPGGGVAALFRYGAVVLFGTDGQLCRFPDALGHRGAPRPGTG